MPPFLESSQKIVGSDSGKAELLNDTFINSNASLNQDAFPVCPSILPSVFTFDNICASDVSRALRSLPAKRSSGSDEIPYQLLKEAGPGIVGPLTTLFNKSLNLQQVPLEWKNAVVIPIYKGGRKDRQNPTSYRPISLTSCVARLMEKLLNTQILRYLQSHSLIFQHQSGFLPNHSTITQLCFLVQKWQMAIDKGEHVQAAFLDLSKAYDRVGIPGLIGKLSALGFSRSSLSWLRSFLTNRKQCVCVNGFKVAQNETLFPKMWWFFFAQIIIYHMLITGSKKLFGVFGWNIALEWGRKLALERKNSRKNILVFLFKRLKARWTDALSLFCLIGIGFTYKKNFRKTFQRLLGRKPRRFCNQLTFSIIQVFAHFLEFLKICPKMLPFFSLKW